MCGGQYWGHWARQTKLGTFSLLADTYCYVIYHNFATFNHISGDVEKSKKQNNNNKTPEWVRDETEGETVSVKVMLDSFHKEIKIIF